LFNGEVATLITFFSGNSRNLKNKGLEIVGICKQKLEIRCLEIVGSELYAQKSVTYWFEKKYLKKHLTPIYACRSLGLNQGPLGLQSNALPLSYFDL
jgi:hypothetical protein